MSCETCRHDANELTEHPCTVCDENSHWESKQDSFDEIHRPAHYANRKIEVIDFISDSNRHGKYIGTEGYFVGNIIKYITRFRLKGTPIKDLKKARYYIDALIREAEFNESK